MSNPTIYLKDYTPPAFSVTSIHLTFDLFESHAEVTNEMQLERLSEGPLVLDGHELTLKHVVLNKKTLTDEHYTLDEEKLTIEHCPNSFKLLIKTRIYPQKNTALSGLYRSNSFFCTQCEAEGFRRMTYYLDRPDVLSVFTTTITAAKDKYPLLLSNGNEVDRGESQDGRHWVSWHDPFKKPCYLFALVAGDLEVVEDTYTTLEEREVTLKVFVEHGEASKAHHAMQSLKAAMRWDEVRFSLEYDLDLYMVVAVSDFNMGAMENKGLNIFNSQYVLARPDTATDMDYAMVEGVIGHEYFHNWTGNRVTCRDWFQLSLKEGLTVFRDQEFSRDMNSKDVCRIQDVKVLRQAQFPEDSGRMRHPVRPASYQEINNFYTATVYNKGAEVIRMLETLLGVDGFRLGMDLYFKRHDGEAVTIEDFVTAMADANNTHLDAFFHWYTQAGTPTVKLTHKHYENGRLMLGFTQSGVETPVPIPIRIAVLSDDAILHEDVLLLDEASKSFEIAVSHEPQYISCFRGFSAPVIFEDDASDEELVGILKVDTDGFAKWEAASRLVRKHLLGAYHAKSDFKLYGSVIDAFDTVMRDYTIDHALKALLITPPSFEEVVIGLKDIDVARVEAIRDAYRSQMGLVLYDICLETYQKLWSTETHDMTGQDFGKRSLRNACLALMMRAKPEQTLAICDKQFEEAETMTDKLASFQLLASHPDQVRARRATESFYETWHQDDLVLDKWFSTQATSEPMGALGRVEALMSHEKFDMKNPNKVRALVGAFCQNARHFHAVDGRGYAFLADCILKLDAINPQIAARLTTPFTRWQRLDAPRQALMQKELKRLASADLSKDVAEIVGKSID